MFEREFGPGQQTYRDTRLFLRGKAARRCAVETGCNDRLADPGWTRCDSMQAIITHGIFSAGVLTQETILLRDAERYLDRCQNIEGARSPRCSEGQRLGSCHAARHETANGNPERPLDRPDHRPANPVRLCNHGIIGNLDPFVIDADQVMTVLRFPIRI